jgi:hypothetical protein
MKCEELFARLEMGHAFDRWRARRHAAGCADCAYALRSFEEAKRRWATTEPLTAKHQESWKAVAGQAAAPTRSGYKAPLAVAGFALAAGLLLVLFVWRPAPGPKNENQREVAIPDKLSPSPIAMLPLSKEIIDEQFAPLEEKLKALEQEIDQIQASAEKRDAQFQLAQLIHQYSKREETMP